MDSIRQEKINNLLKRELALIFQRESHSWFGGKLITVTIVRISPDLGLAKIYLSIFLSDDVEADLKRVREQSWAIRKALASKVGKQLRKMPELAFYIDDSLDYYEEIDQLLKK